MTNPAAREPHTKWGRSIGTAFGAAVAVALILLAFVWPSVTSSLKDIPLAITGPASQVQIVSNAINERLRARFRSPRLTARMQHWIASRPAMRMAPLCLDSSPRS